MDTNNSVTNELNKIITEGLLPVMEAFLNLVRNISANIMYDNDYSYEAGSTIDSFVINNIVSILKATKLLRLNEQALHRITGGRDEQLNENILNFNCFKGLLMFFQPK